MGAFADYMNKQAANAPAEAAPEAEPENPGNFMPSLRSGLYGVGGQLASLGGTAAEALGADGLAQAGYDKSQEMQQRAAELAPRTTLADVTNAPDFSTGLRRAVDFGTGMAGQMVPGVVAGLGGALLTENPLVGATLATAPMEIGDVTQRQQADPTLRSAPAAERLGQAALLGGASAAAMGVVPAGVAGRIAETAGARTVGQMAGHVLADAGTMGAASAGGEAIKQNVDPNKPLDMEAVKDAGISGVIGGGMMGGAGMAGELAHRAIASPGKTLSRVSGAIGDATPDSVKAAGAKIAEAASDTAGAAVDAGAKVVSDPVGTLRDLYDGTKAKAQAFMDRIAKGQDVADTDAVNEAAAGGADQGAITNLLGKLDGERVAAVQQWGSDLLTKAGLSPEAQAQVKEAMGNLADKGSQAVIANAQKAWTAAQAASKALSDVAGDFTTRMAKSKAAFLDDANAAGGVKRSDDYSAIHGDLMDAISPILRESNPAVFADNAAGAKARQDIGGVLRTVLNAYRNGGELGSNDLFKLIGAFGDRAVDILDRTAGVMGWRADARSQDLYARLNELRAQKRDDDSVLGLMQRSLAPELQDTTTMPQLRTELQALREWASAPAKDSPVAQFDHEGVIDALRQRYGDKTDDILNALEKEASAKAGQHALDKDHAATDEHGNEVDKSWEATHGETPMESDRREGDVRDAHVVDYGPEAGASAGSLALHPGLDHPEHGQAVQAYRRAKAENPDKSVSFVGARELGENHPRVKTAIKKLIDGFVEQGMDAKAATKAASDEVMSMVKGKSGAERPKYGIVQAESGDLIPGTIDKHNLDAVKLVPKGKKAPTSWRDNPAVFTADAGGKERTAFDARKIVKEMSRQFAGEYTAEDNKSAAHRTARMFMTGIAALSDHLGKAVDVPDATVIDNNGTTYGDIKKLGFAPSESKEGGEHQTSAQLGNTLTKTRNLIIRMQDKLDARAEQLHKRGVDPSTDPGISVMNSRLIALERRATDIEGHKLKTERDERLAASLADHGKSEADPFGNIHEQASEKVQEITKDLAGNGRDQSDPKLDAKHRVSSDAVKGMTAKIDEISDATKSAGGKKIVERARELIANLDVLPKAAGLRLASIMSKGHTPAAIGEVINELHAKYKAQFKQEYTKAPVVEKAKPQSAAKWAPEKIDRTVKNEAFSGIKTKEDADAFLKGAAKRLAELHAQKDSLTEHEDSAYYNLRGMFEDSKDLGSFYDDTGHERENTNDAVRKMLVKAVPDAATFIDHNGLSSRLVERLKLKYADPKVQKAFGDALGALQRVQSEGKTANDVRTEMGEHVAKLVKLALDGNDNAVRAFAAVNHAIDQITAHGKEPAANDAIHATLQEHGGAASLRSLADIIAEKATSEPAKVLARALRKVAGDIGVTVSGALGASERGRFKLESGDIHLNSNDVGTAMGTVLHEGVHAATARALVKNPQLARAVHDLMAHAAEHDPTIAQAYGMSTMHEFVAEALSNPGFQARLMKMPASDKVAGYLKNTAKNAWDSFVGLIRKALGMPEGEHNALSQALDLTGRAMREVGEEGVHTIDGDSVENGLSKPMVANEDARKVAAQVKFIGENAAENQHMFDSYMKARGDRDFTMSQFAVLSALAVDAHNVPTEMLHAALGSPENVAHSIFGQSGLFSKLHEMDTRYDKLKVKKGLSSDPAARKEVEDYIHSVLGDTVRTEFKDMAHAGEFASRERVADVVRISTRLTSPMETGYHESLHGFFKRLMEQGNSEVGKMLERVAMGEHVQQQLRERFKDNPEVLAQLKEPEEAAAYMYQMWAGGAEGFTVAPVARTFFAKLASAVRKVFGVWSQGERAEHIMEYFKSGQFRSKMDRPDIVSKALIEAGHNKAIEKMQELSKPVLEVAGAVGLASGHRLRATGIPALQELADHIKPSVGAQGKDTGFINAARTQRAVFMHKLGDAMHSNGWTAEHADDALYAMQHGKQASTPEARNMVRMIQGTATRPGLLGDVLQYMKDSGVNVKDIQPRPDYFPRLYDANAITRNMDKFVDVLTKHGITDGQARNLAQRIAGSNGAEFSIETEKPGMQFLKQRALAMIPDAELAPYMKKNLFEIMDSYVTQATRRAEWAKRLGDDGSGVSRLLSKAQQQGASEKDLSTARKYLKAIDGTLGDSLNPTARRLMGNAIVYQNVRLLPLAIFSSVVDPQGIAVRGGTASEAFWTFKRGMSDLRHAWSGAYKEDADSKFAAEVGAIDHDILSGTTSALYTQGMVGDFAKKVNDQFFKLNLMESFNRSMRIGAARAALGFMTRHASGEASPHSARWMRELGYEPGEFDPAKIDDKAKMAINRWVDGAVLRPDAADKPIWMSDPHFMLFSHLKQFVFSYQETILKRVLHEYRNGNFKPAMALTSYVPVMIAADAIKGMLQGGGAQPDWRKDWGLSDWLKDGLERAGLLGVGQFAIDGPGMLMGPTSQQLLQVAEAADGKAAAGHVFAKALPVVGAFSDAGPTFSE